MVKEIAGLKFSQAIEGLSNLHLEIDGDYIFLNDQELRKLRKFLTSKNLGITLVSEEWDYLRTLEVMKNDTQCTFEIKRLDTEDAKISLRLEEMALLVRFLDVWLSK